MERKKIYTNYKIFFIIKVWKLKDEECPQGIKNYGIIDDNENKLCLDSNTTCPINYLSENYIDGFSSIGIGAKTFYYGNDDINKERKIIAGLRADTDLYLEYGDNEDDIIDTYTISGFLWDNPDLYVGVNLGFDPYEKEDIDEKGYSYLRKYYNDKYNLTDLRENK